jgi:hypothetical protein
MGPQLWFRYKQGSNQGTLGGRTQSPCADSIGSKLLNSKKEQRWKQLLSARQQLDLASLPQIPVRQARAAQGLGFRFDRIRTT